MVNSDFIIGAGAFSNVKKMLINKSSLHYNEIDHDYKNYLYLLIKGGYMIEKIITHLPRGEFMLMTNLDGRVYMYIICQKRKNSLKD